ncbi:MAG TPA: DUF4337 domain-containing protein [Vicinamibacterales bacterium]|jgi:hypothetical protein|nr:DUF4337 domain-containing protein [Vicinamibacterales bacterium]
MDPQELLELHEKTREGLTRTVGLTMAIVAALLAVVTLMGHRLHTEEVVLQTKLADQWAYYQAKNTRSQMYATDAQLALLQGAQGRAIAATWDEKARQEREQADEIRRGNEDMDRETQATARRATLFDNAEIFLEIAIVLCSVTLLTGTRIFWIVSFVGTTVGVVLAGLAFLR